MIIKIGEKISVVLLDSVSFFDNEFVLNNINNPKIPEMFLIFSNVRNKLIKELDKNYNDFKVDRIGAWTVVTATKLK